MEVSITATNLALDAAFAIIDADEDYNKRIHTSVEVAVALLDRAMHDADDVEGIASFIDSYLKLVRKKGCAIGTEPEGSLN